MDQASREQSDRHAAATLSMEEYFAFAGRGSFERIDDLDVPASARAFRQPEHHPSLGAWRSTAICGNDITSSVLYVSALCAAQAGLWAPVVLLLVGVLLYLYRFVYGEVGSALPLNGGTYTILLNTTNKRFAASAAVLTLISYAATAVISAADAMEYLHHLYGRLDIYWAALAVLVFFAALNILGLRDSANVALVIFVLHICTLSALTLSGIAAIAHDPSSFRANWQMPSPTGIGHALFYGFSAALLGISGFESSANFIEEQKRGVFPLTLRNMWLAVVVFNPMISLLSFGLLPMTAIRSAPADLLAQMGQRTLGPAFAAWVSVDAILVLSGAVLTSYVGVTGLVRRMALDRCLPHALLRTNNWRGTNHWIILGFCMLGASILTVTNGELSALGGVYTLAFLSVMALYAIGNMLLKVRRTSLPRAIRARWPTVSLALIAVVIGFVGNVMLSPRAVGLFAVYYAVGLTLVGAVFIRVELLKIVLFATRSGMQWLHQMSNRLGDVVMRKIDETSRRPVVYFASDDDAAALNQAILYVVNNEQTRLLKIVHVFQHEGEIPPELAANVEFLDRIYLRLRIDLVTVQGSFGPGIVDALSRRWKIPRNMMFMGTPGRSFPHRIELLGGVRVVV